MRVVDRPVGFAYGGRLERRLGRVLLCRRGGIYLNVRLVSPRIPERGEIDLRAFHADEGRKYLLTYTILSVVTIITNAGLGQGGSAIQWPAQNIVIIPMTIATAIATIFIRKLWVQAFAVAIQVLGWLWYFAKLQSALSG